MNKINYSVVSDLFFILLVVLFCNVEIQAQEIPPPEFTIGAFLSKEPGQGVLASFDTSGLNTVAWHADNNTSSFLEHFKVWANNPGWTDWIQYYATCYYSRWEGEENQLDTLRVGVKHKPGVGQAAYWKNTLCWSSLGVTAPVCSLMYGPHYRQDQRYKSYYHTSNIWGVDYVPRFNLALDNPYSLDSTRNICVLKVVYRYAEIDTSIPPPNWTLHDTTFLQDTLKISDFPRDSSFKIFNVVEGDTNFYRYPDKFHSAIGGDRWTMGPTFPDTIAPTGTGFIYSDLNANNGIQFWVDYLGNDSTTLFIDWAEVYDNNGWDEYVDPITHDSVITKIQSYTQSYPSSEWPNIIYWYGQDEPWTIDAFTPMHIVDSLVRDVGGAPLITEFYPYWTKFNTINGDTLIRQFVEIAKPEKLMIDIYPFGPDPSTNPLGFDVLQQRFQEAHTLQPGFWYVGQGFGLRTANYDWCIWRKPDSTELKASVMFALAYGSKRNYLLEPQIFLISF